MTCDDRMRFIDMCFTDRAESMTTTPQWRVLLETSTQHYTAGTMARKEAGKYLWLGAKAAIRTYKRDEDPTGEKLYRRTLIALGGSRKGSASKIKTVALAKVELGLDLNAYGSLNAAYKAAQMIAAGSETELDPICACPHCQFHHVVTQ